MARSGIGLNEPQGAPLMEFERLKLIKRFKKEGEGENITVDYK